jgi:hypothetical protein
MKKVHFLFFILSSVYTLFSQDRNEFVFQNTESNISQTLLLKNGTWIQVRVGSSCNQAAFDIYRDSLIRSSVNSINSDGFTLVSDIEEADSSHFFICGRSDIADDVAQIKSYFLNNYNDTGRQVFYIQLPVSNIYNGSPVISNSVQNKPKYFALNNEIYKINVVDTGIQLIKVYETKTEINYVYFINDSTLVYSNSNTSNIIKNFQSEEKLNFYINTFVTNSNDGFYYIDGTMKIITHYSIATKKSSIFRLNPSLKINDVSIDVDTIYFYGSNSGGFKSISKCIIKNDSLFQQDVIESEIPNTSISHGDYHQGKHYLVGSQALNNGRLQITFLKKLDDFSFPIIKRPELKLDLISSKLTITDSLYNPFIKVWYYYFRFESVLSVKNIGNSPVSNFHFASHQYSRNPCYPRWENTYRKVILTNDSILISVQYKTENFSADKELDVEFYAFAANELLENNSIDNFLAKQIKVITSIQNNHIIDNILIYPNPCRDEIYIKNIPTQNFKIVNIFGQEVLNIVNHNEDKPISGTLLPSGIYFIQLKGAVFPKMILKE